MDGEALAGATQGGVARPERFAGPGAQALHPARLPGLGPGGQASQLPAGLYPKGPAALFLCAQGHGGSLERALENGRRIEQLLKEMGPALLREYRAQNPAQTGPAVRIRRSLPQKTRSKS